MTKKGFTQPTLDNQMLETLQERARIARGDILTMTTLAGCGHPGGSMSSIDMYITLFACAGVSPDQPHDPDRDRIVISHGHTSPGAYAALAGTGFFDINEVFSGFRYPGSIYEGHVERCVPGIEWGTGNLGQGLSAGCGFAMAARLKNKNYHTYVVMGDGEQQKGQITEARRFAVKYKLSNITVLVDLNNLQISGDRLEVMPQNISENFRSDGWNVVEIDGHNIQEIYAAVYAARQDSSAPTAIIARTVMGKGVSFMENVAKYHGVALNDEQYAQACGELSIANELEQYRQKRTSQPPVLTEAHSDCSGNAAQLNPGTPIVYESDKKTDNRSAFGNALKSLAEANKDSADSVMAVFDCDLAGSVKTNGFQSVLPDNFIQVGIQEHSTATIAGAMSIEGITTYFADFGVFGVCETYNQHRLNDINHSNLKLVCTHVGYDVGEDGKTHQCIDYIGLFQNIFGFKTVVPADPNQTDKITRYISTTDGNFFMGMGRSKIPTIVDDKGAPFFGDSYTFEYGKIDTIRQGSDAVIMTCGGMLFRAVEACNALKDQGISVRVLNVSCPKDIEIEVLREAAQTGLIVTYEDHNVHTGLGTIIADNLVANNIACRLIKLGVTDYGFSGSPDVLFSANGLDSASLARTIKEALA